MGTFDLARKDLAQIIRDWKSTLFLVVMPILFTLFFGFVSRVGESGGDPRLPVGLIDHDGTGSLATDLQDLLSASELVRPVLLDPATDVDAQVRDGDLAAAIVVPAGFTSEALAGEAPPLTIVTDASTTAGQTAHSGIETAATRLLGAVETALISADEYAA